MPAKNIAQPRTWLIFLNLSASDGSGHRSGSNAIAYIKLASPSGIRSLSVSQTYQAMPTHIFDEALRREFWSDTNRQSRVLFCNLPRAGFVCVLAVAVRFQPSGAREIVR
ncbi:MAG: hypothetical protein AB1861_07775 [Cyanobacteriota bacterium]